MQRSTAHLFSTKATKKSYFRRRKQNLKLKNSILSIFALPLICALPPSASAITYDDPACYDAQYLEQFYRDSEYVFVARIVEQVDKAPRIATYQVIKAWKGDIGKDVTFSYTASFPVKIADSNAYRIPMGNKDEIGDVKLFMVNGKSRIVHDHFVPFTEVGCNTVRKITDLNPQVDMNVRALENLNKQMSEE